MTLDIGFFVVGAQKAGTTTLHEMLREHDELSLPTIKETHFFSHEDRRRNGEGWYLAQFSPSAGARMRGEVDPEYMYHEGAAAAIREATSARKFVFLLRNPLERAFSQYRMTQRRGYEDLSFREAIAAERDRLSGPRRSFALDHWSYIDRSLYSGQIERFLATFPTGEFLFVRSEDLGSSGRPGYRQVCAFLGLSPKEEGPGGPVHRANVASEPKSRALRDLLYAPRGKSPARRLAMSLIPRPVKILAFTAIDALNSRPLREHAAPESVLDAIDGPTRRLLSDDIARTERLTGLDLTSWQDAPREAATA